MQNDLVKKFLERYDSFIQEDYSNSRDIITKNVMKSRIVVLGGAGSIGSKVVELLCSYNPSLIHVIDINENGLVELVRNIRSSQGYTTGEFKTFVMDIGHNDFEKFINNGEGYDIWLNFSAMKHVRSEKDAYSLMRLININIINTYKTLKLASKSNAKKYFSVSTDKAANPINLMGASKRIMEKILGAFSNHIDVSSARFGNVAFSSGSLLDGMINRFNFMQPLVAPKDVVRYFITSEEAAKLSILATFMGKNGELFIPNSNLRNLECSFPKIVKNFLDYKGYQMDICSSEEEARQKVKTINSKNKWPCYLFDTDTDGEKLKEIFIGKNDKLKEDRFSKLQIISLKNICKIDDIEIFIKSIDNLRNKKTWSVAEISNLIKFLIKDFEHYHTGKSLDSRM